MAYARKAFDAFETGGQRYVHIADRPHERRDGSFTVLHVWQTECRTCGHPFIIEAPHKPVPPAPNRRCKPCIQADPLRDANGQRIKRNANLPPWMPDSETGHPEPPPAPSASESAPQPGISTPPAVARPQVRQRGAIKTGKRSAFTDR